MFHGALAEILWFAFADSHAFAMALGWNVCVCERVCDGTDEIHFIRVIEIDANILALRVMPACERGCE